MQTSTIPTIYRCLLYLIYLVGAIYGVIFASQIRDQVSVFPIIVQALATIHTSKPRTWLPSLSSRTGDRAYPKHVARDQGESEDRARRVSRTPLSTRTNFHL